MSDERIQGSKFGITIAVMCAALMAFVDISIVNVALSDIRASFGTPLDQIAWVSTGYMMANIVVIPLTGWLQRRFGYKRYFTASILLFTLASTLCGLAWDLPSLVVFRVLQGVGGGAIIPTSQAILFARYPKEEHGMAGALFGLGAMTGPLLGPTIGGYLIDWSGWHWIFLINVPIGITAAILVWNNVHEPGWERPNEPIDKWGIALLAVGMATLQYVLEEGNRNDWLQSTEIVVLSAVAGVCLVTFLVHELETPNPVVDLSCFANRTYGLATVINFLLGTALFSGMYLFSLYLGAVMRYTALDIGRIFLVAGGIQILMMPIVGRLAGKVDGRYLLAFGITTTASGLFLTTRFTASASFWNLAHPRMLQGIGMSFVFIPLSVAALSDVPAHKRGNATGLFNLTRELGGSIGTAWMGMNIANGLKINGSALASYVTPYSLPTQEQVAALQASVGARTTDPVAAAYGIVQARIGLQALIRTFNEAFWLVSLGFVATLVLVFFLKKPKAGMRPAGAH